MLVAPRHRTNQAKIRSSVPGRDLFDFPSMNLENTCEGPGSQDGIGRVHPPMVRRTKATNVRPLATPVAERQHGEDIEEGPSLGLSDIAAQGGFRGRCIPRDRRVARCGDALARKPEVWRLLQATSERSGLRNDFALGLGGGLGLADVNEPEFWINVDDRCLRAT